MLSDQDQQRRGEARQAQPFQRIGHRIEEIGQHQAGDEGQQDVAESHRTRIRTTSAATQKTDLALQGHGVSFLLAAIGHMADPFAQVKGAGGDGEYGDDNGAADQQDQVASTSEAEHGEHGAGKHDLGQRC